LLPSILQLASSSGGGAHAEELGALMYSPQSPDKISEAVNLVEERCVDAREFLKDFPDTSEIVSACRACEKLARELNSRVHG
jgi:hypothetical protein